MEQPIITLQTQTEPFNCMSACLAMLLNQPVETISEEFHERYMTTLDTPTMYLAEKGLTVRRHYADERLVDEPSRVYLLSVPSLNIEAGLHGVVAETNAEGMWWIYDPNEGREGRKFYTNTTIDGYVIESSVSVEELMEYRNRVEI